MEKITIQSSELGKTNLSKVLEIEVDDLSQVSDGYHTIAELYEHRIALFIALCKLITDHELWKMIAEGNTKFTVWRSKYHSDGSPAYDGWFVLGIGKKDGKIITYHIPNRYWEECSFAEEVPKAFFDGHTSADVLERLKTL